MFCTEKKASSSKKEKKEKKEKRDRKDKDKHREGKKTKHQSKELDDAEKPIERYEADAAPNAALSSVAR